MSELTVNHYEICCLLCTGSISQAQQCFYDKINGQDLSASARGMILSSLNYAIYNFFLIQNNLSLHDCCVQNERRISHASADTFWKTANEVIASYRASSLERTAKHENPYIRRALAYIHEHLNEELTLQSVSSLLFMNKNYFCQLFCRETGVSFTNYVCEQRMKLADQLLRGTSLTVQEIAEKCGFQNAAYFSTCCKKHFGCTPSRLRKR